ncbi:hypothetical protein BaRGS_00018357 [Batillaria attramentaria]|uniref:Uncharacterized protein n=1 Tax=Batillaria attramentaria TaxID=370345 RepID=A0ABD0KTP8_9CAEN
MGERGGGPEGVRGWERGQEAEKEDTPLLSLEAVHQGVVFIHTARASLSQAERTAAEDNAVAKNSTSKTCLSSDRKVTQTGRQLACCKTEITQTHAQAQQRTGLRTCFIGVLAFMTRHQ